jgi:hypothetical protein
MVNEFISLLLTMAALKGMTGALAPFSQLSSMIIPQARSINFEKMLRIGLTTTNACFSHFFWVNY